MRQNFQAPWANISDMMAALMMLFLLISVVYGSQVTSQSAELQETNSKITEITDSYKDNRSEIYKSLEENFSDKFEEWGAVLDKDTLTLRFNDPALLFEAGSSELTPRFREILQSFWPRYTQVLSEYSEDIREIRIEGHTSSEWADASIEQSYFNNMRLSQQRTRTTLEFCYYLTPDSYQDWVRGHVTANGMSFSRLVLDNSGGEDATASRRVEFTVVVDSRSAVEQIGRILDE